MGLVSRRFVLVLLGAGSGTLPSVGQVAPCLAPARGHHPIFGAPASRVDTQDLPAWAVQAAFGDLNGDGLPDAVIAVPSGSSGYVSVCMNLGGGTFGPPAVNHIGANCCAVALGDFNRDGLLDIVAVDPDDNTVSFLFNRGAGVFGPPATYSVGTRPRSVVVADFNRDGWPDVAVLNCGSNDVSVLTNRGDGSFTGQTVPIGFVSQPISLVVRESPGPFLAVGDLNGDGAPDLVVPASAAVRVLLNDGTGTLVLSPIAASLGSGGAYGLAIADFNRDGNLDVAAVGPVGRASVILGHGDGTFGAPAVYTTHPFGPGFGPITCSISAGDLDGDGFPDLAVGHYQAHGLATVFRNLGDGSFGAPEYHDCGAPDWFVSLTDLRGSGRPDMAVLAPCDNGTDLRVSLNDGHGALLDPVRIPGWTDGWDFFYRGAVADIDGDGAPDAAIGIASGPNQIRIVRGLGNGQLGLSTAISYGPQGQACCDGIALADLNGDGRPDVVAADPIVTGGYTAPGNIWVSLNMGGFNFAPPTRYPLSGVTPTYVRVADLNGDGRPDIVASSTGVFQGSNVPVDRCLQVLINRGDGSFDPPVTYVIGSGTREFFPDVAIADLDRDGRPDLVANLGPLNLPGHVVVLHNRGDGTFEPWQSIPVASQPYALATADFDGDGWPDVAVVHCHGCGPTPPINEPYLTILRNNGAGALSIAAEYTDRDLQTGSEIIAADFDGDGRPDLLFTDGRASVVLMLNRGDGAFDPPVPYGATNGYDGSPWGLMLADFDRDGRTDLLVTEPGTNALTFLRNVSCPACYANCDRSTTPPYLNAGDFVCFLQKFAAGDPYANCDGSTVQPTLNVLDFICFQQRFAAGCP
jgi:hypothetical protein